MSFVSAADIFKLCSIAFNLWDFAFRKAKNAGKVTHFPIRPLLMINRFYEFGVRAAGRVHA